MEIDPFIFRLSIFVLSIFVGYYVVWSVTPSLHTPLMSVTNAISSVIIVGAIIAAANLTPGTDFKLSNMFGIVAITLAAINIFGGFLVTQRMLQMYKKKKKNKLKLTSDDRPDAATIAPTIITDEIALVTDIKGVCNEGVTLQTT